MSAYLDRVAQHIRETEEDLRREVEAQQKRWHYRVHRRRVWFDREVRRAHKGLKQSIPSFLWEANVFSLPMAPVIYSLIVPLAVLDLWVTVYQWICFPICGMSRVRRRSYFVIDRHKLAYLNAIEKLHCTYCSYVNGLIGYVREIAARTEQYWRPIKHARIIPTPHSRYHRFFDYGDAGRYRRELTALRVNLRREPSRIKRVKSIHVR